MIQAQASYKLLKLLLRQTSPMEMLGVTGTTLPR
jgi:hypothetical protein